MEKKTRFSPITYGMWSLGGFMLFFWAKALFEIVPTMASAWALWSLFALLVLHFVKKLLQMHRLYQQLKLCPFNRPHLYVDLWLSHGFGFFVLVALCVAIWVVQQDNLFGCVYLLGFGMIVVFFYAIYRALVNSLFTEMEKCLKTTKK